MTQRISNAKVTRAFRLMADLLEIGGESGYRAGAYSRIECPKAESTEGQEPPSTSIFCDVRHSVSVCTVHWAGY
jgi:hypothetical protein